MGFLALVSSAALACDSSVAPPEAFLLTVAEPPQGAGTIQSQPPGIIALGLVQLSSRRERQSTSRYLPPRAGISKDGPEHAPG